MRTLGALAAHLTGRSHTRCAMVRLDLVDGTTLAFTDHDKPIAFDLGDGTATYLPDTGILPSDLSLSAGFDADDMDISGPIGDTITRAAVIGGRFDDAVVRYFQVNWADPTAAAKLLKGRVVLPQIDGGKFKLTVHSEISKFNQSVGRRITGYCENDFGVGNCPRTRIDLAATVSAVTDARTFSVTYSGAYADDFFNTGTVYFLTGAMAGCRPVEIFDWSTAGDLALWTELAEPPQVGDTLEVRQGCYDVATSASKTRNACKALGGDAIPFRGFPDVPGSDQVLKYPNPSG